MPLAGIFAALLMALPAAANAASEPLPTELSARVRADHAALQRAETDFRRLLQLGRLSPAEAEDYMGYLRLLQERIAAGCRALLAPAMGALAEDLPCRSLPLGRVPPLSIGPTAEQTEDEKTATLDADLNATLGEFDEMLLREQGRVKAAAPMSDSKAGGGRGDIGSGKATGSGAPGAADSASETPPGSVASSAGATDGSHGGSLGGGEGARAPRQGDAQDSDPDMPDGSDDDVVARQLREAAEKERDPELRKKLWEEYRRYKEGSG